MKLIVFSFQTLVFALLDDDVDHAALVIFIGSRLPPRLFVVFGFLPVPYAVSSVHHVVVQPRDLR